jgi:hypothetical protein
MQKIAEVIEASTTEFTAECYELYSLPPLGSLVKTADGATELYGVVYNASTSSVEAGRRPIARGKNEDSEDAVYRSNPQLSKLLRSEFSSIVVGHRSGQILRQYLAPGPARIHGFVYLCPPEQVREFSGSLDFLSVLLNVRLSVPGEEVAGAALRQMSLAHEDRRQFLVAAGKELAVMLGDDFNRLRTVLSRIKGASI